MTELCREVVQVWDGLNARHARRVPKFQDDDFAFELFPSDVFNGRSLRNRAQYEGRRNFANLWTDFGGHSEGHACRKPDCTECHHGFRKFSHNWRQLSRRSLGLFMSVMGQSSGAAVLVVDLGYGIGADLHIFTNWFFMVVASWWLGEGKCSRWLAALRAKMRETIMIVYPGLACQSEALAGSLGYK